MRLAITGLAILALILSGLAGCAGKGGETKSADDEPGSTVQATSEPLADAGIIEGIVMDDSGLPISGATVAIVEPPLEVVSDEAGAFSFTNLAPGKYQVAALKLGYDSVARLVQVLPSEVTQVTFTLVPIPIIEAYSETFGPLVGYFECRLGNPSWTATCGTVCASVVGCAGPPSDVVYPNDKSILRFRMSRDDYASVVGDMRWTPSATGTSQALRFAFSHDNRTSTHWWCSAEGKTPAQFRLEKEGDSVCSNVGSNKVPPEPTSELALRMYANAPFGTTSNPVYVSVQQKFEIMASVFYGERAPEGYTAFPDA